MEQRVHQRTHSAFTLVELLVVVGIIALLVAIFMPSLMMARRAANRLACASNLRQLATALINYSTENRGKFPPNRSIVPPAQYWYQADRIGRYIRTFTDVSGNLSATVADNPGGGVYVCPDDTSDSMRSYAMNVWAGGVDLTLTTPPLIGVPFSYRVPQASRMILLGERYATSVTTRRTYYCTATIGAYGVTPGLRFGGGGGILLSGGSRWGVINSELPYWRHRTRGNGTGTLPKGAVNFAYADGHVALKRHDELYDVATGLSTLDSLWSPLDPQINE